MVRGSSGLLLLELALGFAARIPDTVERDDGIRWSIIGDSEYFVHNGTDKKDYDGATKRCEELGAHLVIVSTDEAQNIVVKLIRQTTGIHRGVPYPSFYIGLRDYTGHNANFVWADGEMLHFIHGTPMHWANGEPNNFNGQDEDCVTMGSAGLVANYDWFDVPCSVRRSYICQRYTADAVNPAGTGAYLFNGGVVFFVFASMFFTGLYHRRKISAVKLALPVTPTPSEAGDARPEVIKFDPDNEFYVDDQNDRTSTVGL